MIVNKKYSIVVIILSVTVGLIIFLFSLKQTQQPNILLITIDALRPDHLGCYGYKRNTSPNIDKLAKEGVMFTQAITQGIWTPPSITSIITSTQPYMHQVFNFGDSVNPAISTFPEILKEEGYHTGFISPGYFRTIIGLDRGFDLFDAEDDAYKLTQKAINWIEINKNKPFFLWLHYLDTHFPYKAPPPYDEIFLNDGLYYNGKIKNLPVTDLKIGIGAIPEFGVKNNITDGNYYISQYDGAIRSIDTQIGILLNKLKRLNLDKNTLIIITADHGESLGEFDIYFSHVSFLESVIKVPLIIRYNNLIPKNKAINSQVQLIDIAPTILDILKADKTSFMQGVSLLPVISGRGNYPSSYTFLYADEAAYSIRTSEWKLIYIDYERLKSFMRIKGANKDGLLLVDHLRHKAGGVAPSEYILFSLEEDPQEQTNLINLEKERFMLLKEKLEEFLNSWEHISPVAKEEKILDEETKEKLKSLGYIQ